MYREDFYCIHHNSNEWKKNTFWTSNLSDLQMSWRYLSRSVRFYNNYEKGRKGSTKAHTLPKNKIAKMLTMSLGSQIIWQFCLKVIALNHELYYMHFAQCAGNLLHEAWKCWTQKGFCYILTWLPGGPWTFIFAFLSTNFFCSDHLYAYLILVTVASSDFFLQTVFF